MTPVSPAPEPHEVLGIARDADAATVKRAYRRLMQTAHPDQGGTEGMFRLIQAAHDTLLRQSGSSTSRSNQKSSDAQPGPPPASTARPRDPEDERRRAEEARISAEYARRRRQAYREHPDDPWLAEFKARQGEEHRASPLSDAELLAGLREMIRRQLPAPFYPEPGMWSDSQVVITRTAQRQDRFRVQLAHERDAEAEAARVATQREQDAQLSAREKALGPTFVPASVQRAALLKRSELRGELAQSVSTVALDALIPRINRARSRAVAIAVAIPLVPGAIATADAVLVSTGSGGSPTLFANLAGVTLLMLSWAPAVIARGTYSGWRDRLLAKSPSYQGSLNDRIDWIDRAESRAKEAKRR